MKIENNFNPYIDNNKKPEKPEKSANKPEGKNTDFYNTPNPAESLGRSQVTVKRKSLSDGDKAFIDAVSQTLNLSEKEKQSLKQLIVDYFKTYKFTSLNDLSGAEHLEDVAVIAETAVQILELSPNEEMTLLAELTKKTIFQDDYQPQIDVYRKDFDLLQDVCEKYGIDTIDCHSIYNIMSEYASAAEEKSLFSSLIKDKNKHLDDCITDLQSVTGFDDKKFEDFVLDLVNSRKIDNSVRKKVGLENTSNAIFYRDMSELVIAKNVIQKFGLNEKNEKYITELLANRTKQDDSKENMKTAFLIADKFRLCGNAENTILEIIKDIQSKDYRYFDQIFIDELTNEK